MEFSLSMVLAAIALAVLPVVVCDWRSGRRSHRDLSATESWRQRR